MSSANGRADAVDDHLARIWQDAARARLPLPTEADLAAMLGISRPMVREALVRMEGRGLVARRAHQGTFPNVAALSVPFRIDESYELSASFREAGHEVRVDVVSARWSTLVEHEAAELESAAGACCFRVRKRWLVDGRPLVMAEDVVPAQPRDDVDFDRDHSVFASVQRLRGVAVEWESATLRPVLADAVAQDLLGVGPEQPLLVIDVVGVSLHGDKLYLGQETHRVDGPSYGMVRRAVRHS